MLVTRKLTITVEYETNDIDGSAVAQIERNLHYIATHASGNGMLTSDTDATVEDFHAIVS